MLFRPLRVWKARHLLPGWHTGQHQILLCSAHKDSGPSLPPPFPNSPSRESQFLTISYIQLNTKLFQFWNCHPLTRRSASRTKKSPKRRLSLRDLIQTLPPTISLIRLPRVGGAWRPSRVASRRCFSTMMPSMSSRRAISVLSGVIGIDRVAKRTRVDILLTKYNHKRWTAREYYFIFIHMPIQE